MGLHLSVLDLDEVHDNFKGKMVYANDFNTSTVEGKEAFHRHFYSHYKDSEAVENSASCDCDYLDEAHFLGVICEVCGTPVVSTSNRPIVPSMWIRAPEGVDRLISPQLWIMLSNYLTMKEFDFLEYLTNTAYSYDYNAITSKETKRKLDRLLQRDFPRGLNNFVRNFDEIFQFLLDSNIINNNKNEMYTFIQLNKSKMFPKHIPIPSKLCFVAESTTSGNYIDEPIGPAIEGVLTFCSIGGSPIPIKPHIVQNRVAESLKNISNYHKNLAKTRIAQKPGLVRRHVLGGRLNFTVRAVITSISDPHRADDLWLPWGAACQLFKYHAINKLKRKYRMTTRKAMSHIYEHVLKYCPILDEIFNELIRESKYGRIPCVLHRNPTLQRGSTQRLFISKIKTDLRDNSISLSILILKAPNKSS